MAIMESLKVKHPRLARLLASQALLGWLSIAIVAWKVCANISTLQTARGIVAMIWDAINGPHGSLILLAFGFVWLTAVALWPANTTRLPITDKHTELALSIQEVLFYREPLNNLISPSGMSKVSILLKVRAVNTHETTRAPQHWKLTVRAGSFAADAEMAHVDSRLSIKRYTSLLTEDVNNEPIRPAWDELTEAAMPTGVPTVAWAEFTLLLHGWFGAAPHNAEFILTVTDSLGATHVSTREPQMYFESAKIVKGAA